jgi:hypothetical protein
MGLARAGKGEVFGIGDPWLYNEYMAATTIGK